MSTTGLAQRAAAPLLLAPRGPSPRVLMISTIFLGAALLGLARVDNAPGALATAGLLVAAWLPSALRLRRTWAVGIWMLWVLCLGIAQVGWLFARDVNAPTTLRGANGSSVSCEYRFDDNGQSSYDAFFIERMIVILGTSGLLAGLGRLMGAYRRESIAPCHDSAEHLAIVAGVWLSLAGGLSILDAATLKDRVLLCDASGAVRDAHTGVLSDAFRPTMCEPIEQRGAGWGSRLCAKVPAPATRPLAILLGTLVAGLGALGAGLAASRTRRRSRWLDGWLTEVRLGDIHGWSLGAAVPTMKDSPASGVSEQQPWLVRADGDGLDGFHQPLVYSSDPQAENPWAEYRRKPVSAVGHAVVVARLEQNFAAGSVERMRRGEIGARKLVVTVVGYSLLLVVPLMIFIFATNRRF